VLAHKKMEVFMNATLADYSDDFELATVKPAPRPDKTVAAHQARSPKTDIHLWLSNNAPSTVEELNAVRY
jgi:hypothetical protein